MKVAMAKKARAMLAAMAVFEMVAELATATVAEVAVAMVVETV